MRFNLLAWVLVSGCLQLVTPPQTHAQSWTATNIYNNWTSVAATADGSKIAAASFIGDFYTSTDAGTNWLATSSPDPSQWPVLAASADGDNLAAAFYGGAIYTSANWGGTWQPSAAPIDRWNCLASSADGTKFAAGTSPGVLYTSKDSGATFTSRLPQNNAYQAIAGSDSNLVAVVLGGKIYRSTDLGETWAATTAPPANWSSIAASISGVNLAAAIQGGGIYTSADSGVSWTITSAPSTNWESIASSADGSQLVAAVNGGGLIYISNDSGVTWTNTTAPSNNWAAVYSSPDGTNLLALANGGGGNYFSTDSGSNWSERYINDQPGSTNLICTDTFSLTLTYGVNTSMVSAIVPIPARALTGQSVIITNSVGINWPSATITNKNVLNVTASLGVNDQDGNVFSFSPVVTNLLGTNFFGIGATIPKSSGFNTLPAQLPILTNIGTTGTNIILVWASTVSGVGIVISNVLSVQAVTAGNPAQTWSAVAASADGSCLVAAINGGLLYRSTNFGATWSTNSGLIAVYSTMNSGVSWTNTTNSVSSPNRYWSALASSADGTKLVATVANGGIFTSSDSGTTWVSNNVPWQVLDGEDFPPTNDFTATNYSTWAASGVIWTSNSVPPQDWSAVYSSPDGNTLVALARDGWSFKSTNGGATWVGLSTPYDFWQSVASSADGGKLLAASQGGYVYLSTNAGTSWNELVITPGGTNLISADTFFFSATYTNWNKTSADTNDFKTDAYGPFIEIPNVAVSNGVIGVTNVIDLNLFGIVATATNIVATNSASVTNYTYGANVLLVGLGVNEQGSNVFGPGSVSTDILGPQALVGDRILPNSAFSNVVDAAFTVPDGTGLFNTNGIFSTNLVNIASSDASGISVLISNVLNINVVVVNGPQTWAAVAMSADGSHLAAAVNGGGIYTSTNSGLAWSVTDAPETNWSAMALSSDGYTLVAFSTNGLLAVSSDFGGTWAETNLPASTRCSVAVSANGSELLAVMYPGYIYSAQTTPVVRTSAGPVPTPTISAVNGNIILSWPAGPTNWTLQQRADLSVASSWADVSAVPSVANGQNQVTLPLSANLRFFRLRD